MAVTADDLALREDICYQIFGDVGPLIRGKISAPRLGSEGCLCGRTKRRSADLVSTPPVTTLCTHALGGRFGTEVDRGI